MAGDNQHEGRSAHVSWLQRQQHLPVKRVLSKHAQWHHYNLQLYIQRLQYKITGLHALYTIECGTLCLSINQIPNV